MKGRNFRKNKPITRRKGTRLKPKIKIYAFCEGKNTEPEFINKFSLIHGNGLVEVKCVGAVGTPVTIVDECTKEIKNLRRQQRKSNDPLDKNFQIWAVFDRDEHPNVSSAIDKASANNIKVAFSNPCFELWPLLHFESQTANIHRKVLQKHLETKLDGYDSEVSKSVCPEQLGKKGCYETAKKRAMSLHTTHTQVGVKLVDMNPYTNVYELFDEIIENGKKQKSD
ncbi:RloB family protein [Vibrio nigripulchritudo]|uniref:RloB family protein n=1 Tax=Vibrio nigripulchritudo TaxID=28173 RepID=UPI000697F311|nr:RloB family protein [Vibrio nigripulchritudo]